MSQDHPASESSSSSENPTPSPSQPNGSPSNIAPQADTSRPPSTQTTPSPSDPPQSRLRCHRTTHIQIRDIDTPDELNGRLGLDENRISELTHLIARDGLLTPILVRAVGDRYELIAGNHRLAAMRRLNWDQTAAMLIAGDDYEAARLRLVENTARTDLSPVEEAKQLAVLVEAHPNGVDGVAADIHRRTEWILDRLEIVQYPESLLQHVHAKRISLAAAKWLARQPDDVIRETNIHFAATGGCTARMARQWLNQAVAEDIPAPPASENARFSDGDAFLTRTLARCFVCRDHFDLDQTRPERLCTRCIESIEQTWQNPPTNPPRPAEHPQAAQTTIADPNPTASGTDGC